MTPAEVTRIAMVAAQHAGFARAGVVPIDVPMRYRAYRAWLRAGYAGSMNYLSRPHQLAARRDARVLSSEARSAIVVALSYAHNGGDQNAHDMTHGFVARYARNRDYHIVVRDKLMTIVTAISQALGHEVIGRPCVDSAPLLERELAQAAGLGFIAKNTMLIVPGLGSYFVLGVLLLNIDAAPSRSSRTDNTVRTQTRCGSCTACLDACPTNAFVDDYILDARRCISYLTIEHRGVIDPPLRAPMANSLFGCDICQQVCPYNTTGPARAPITPELAPARSDSGAVDLLGLLGLGTNQLRKRLAATALRRANRHMLMRNACIALGNLPPDTNTNTHAAAIVTLTATLRDHSPLVRGHAAWALGRLGETEALRNALLTETDSYVRSELYAALAPRQYQREPPSPPS